MTHDQVHLQWEQPEVARRFRSGVSLHSHTMHSKESLSFLKIVLHCNSLLSGIFTPLERRYERCFGKAVDYSRGYWTPPLPAANALEVERNQIRGLGLEPLVSLTDHDTLEAPTMLHVLDKSSEVPFSVEWTVPFGSAIFHIGVHNLPPARSRAFMETFQQFTAAPNDDLLGDILRELHRIPEVLIVLNHPFGDPTCIGPQQQEETVRRFLSRYEGTIHALELNGMYTWADNLNVRALARELGLPPISGGDRHACGPNVNLNLTNAATFSEFVDEIRDGQSTIVYMPQYRVSRRERYVESIWEVMKDHPNLPGRERWSDRVFYYMPDRGYQPLSVLWPHGGPPVVRYFFAILRLTMKERVRPALRLALTMGEEPSV